MENEHNILDTIYEEDNMDDVDMIDVEEGELVESDSLNVPGKNSAGDIDETNQEARNKNRSHKAKKKKKRKRKDSRSTSTTDIDRFVLDTCRRLKEKKSYMVYTAVGCLGISALSELIKEVDAIQACGGQRTTDGRRFRTGGGILWSIIKVREPKVYREIMTRAKEFEKQFRQPRTKPLPVSMKEEYSSHRDQCNVSDSAFLASEMQNQYGPEISEEKPISVHDRLRIPVSYDDDLLGEDPNNYVN